MTPDRFVVLGLASARSTWFRQVTGWAMSGALSLEFIKCLSVDELRARLRSGQPSSAVLLDGGLPSVDRDLLALADDKGNATIIVAAPQHERDWAALGARLVLQPDFVREDLAQGLHQHARPIRRNGAGPNIDKTPRALPEARMVAVIGRPGSGVSTCSIALAQALADDPLQGGRVVLVDLARPGDQAMLHDAHDIVPCIQELAEIHRTTTPSSEQVRAHTFEVPGRGYDLLLGLRRTRDWVSLRARSLEAALDGLRRAYHIVVADLDDDLEGHGDGGSSDVEERNLPSRLSVVKADVVMVVADSSLVGLHNLVRLVDELVDLGVSPTRLQPVITRSSRSGRARSELNKTLLALSGTDHRLELPTPLHLTEKRRLDDVHRSGQRLPAALCGPLGHSAISLFSDDRPTIERQARPEPVVPGSLGHWTDET